MIKEKGKLVAGSYETWPSNWSVGDLNSTNWPIQMPKRLANYFLKSVTGRLWQKKPRNFPIQMILTLLWMETCHQFVFERMDLSFPQQRGKALRSSVILKNLGANWHLKIILNVCLLEFFGAHGFHLGERLNWRVRSSNSSVHLSPSLLLGVKIAWFSTCLTHTPPLCRKREIISPLDRKSVV